jgi:hypothetical protein
MPPELLRLGKMSPAGDVYAFGESCVWLPDAAPRRVPLRANSLSFLFHV